MTDNDSLARGREARADVPRSSHAEWAPAPARPDPVDLLEAQATTPGAGARADPLRPDAGLAVRVLPRRRGGHGRRPGGTPTVRASRAALRRRAPVELRRRSPRPSARLVFDINDFDETLPGPWEWDVKRLAASFEVAGREHGFRRRATARMRRCAARRASTARRCARFAGMRDARRLVRPRSTSDELFEAAGGGRRRRAQQVQARPREAVAKARPEGQPRARSRSSTARRSTASRASSPTRR